MKNENQPTAHITVEKKRIKQYDDIVYLSDQKEFELELYNPTNGKILAKIEVNGKSIGNGIILRPCERVFLERHIDVAKKFLFETYSVERNDPNLKNAIANNGSVEVKFYNELVQQYHSNPITFNGSLNNPTTRPNYNYFYLTSTPIFGSTTITQGTTFTTPTSFTTSNTGTYNTSTSNESVGGKVSGISKGNYGSLDIGTQPINKVTMDSLETGRIEQGSNSTQNFTYDNSNFYSFHSWNSKWKILPYSQKPLVIEEIKVFCTECGTKRKKDSHKFCPQCGNKY